METNKNHYLAQDPHGANESERYETPVPSREYIKLILETSSQPLKIEELIENLGVLPEHLQGFKTRVKAMLRDGNIVRTRKKTYQVAKNFPQIQGFVRGHADGFGSLMADKIKYFISNREMRKVMHGDLVQAEIIAQGRNKNSEVIIREVLKRNTKIIIGTVSVEGKLTVVSSLNRQQFQDIIIVDPPKLKKDYLVSVEITSQPTAKSQPLGKILEFINPQKQKNLYTYLALKSFEIPQKWSKETLNRAKDFKSDISQASCTKAIKQGRLDLRKTPFCTIDGEHSKDFDDALHCRKTKTGWTLIVAIADVSHYIETGDVLDKEAYRRGNSVYFPDKTVPMLPEQLSNELCSLKPDVYRFCLTCEMNVNEQGEVADYNFYDSIIQSAARLTYTKVGSLLKTKNHKDWDDYPLDLQNSLNDLSTLYDEQKKARKRRGGIDIEVTDVEFQLDSIGKIEKIKPITRGRAHKIVEECMLMANVCAAKYLQSHRKAFLYRVHDEPKSDKLSDLKELLSDLGIKMTGDDHPSALDYSTVLDEVKEKPYAHIIQIAILKTFKQATYSPENLGHFGLNYLEYTHFTSPIRRYPDLLVHRTIKSVIHNENNKKFDEEMKTLETVGEYLSNTERRADSATMDVTERLKCEFASHQINQKFKGIVNGVMPFGLFIDLQGIYIDGLLHISSLGKSYFRHDVIHHQLKCDKTGKTYELGDTLEVIIKSVSVNDKKIDLKLVN